MTEVNVFASEYIVSVLPVDDVEWGTYSLRIAWRNEGQWAVLRLPRGI